MVQYDDAFWIGGTARTRTAALHGGDLQLNVDTAGHEYLEFNERNTKTRPGNSRDTRPLSQRCLRLK